MFSRKGSLSVIQNLLHQGNYAWSNKVNQSMQQGWFDEKDLEESIRTGVVQKTEKDRFKNSVGNKVYVILGRDTHGKAFYTAGKILRSNEGKIYFFITAHEAR